MMKKTLLFLLTVCYLVAGAQLNTNVVPFTFTLNSSVSTSAGVFKSDGTLIRTLWSGIKYSSGTYTRSWDGTDDEGKHVADDSYTIKVLSNNVQYQWEGVVGNTSANKTGATVHRSYAGIHDMAITNGFAYHAEGYNEAAPSQMKFPLSNPQLKIDVLPAAHATSLAAAHIATDGINVYYGGVDPYSGRNNMVYATRVLDDAEVTFVNGGAYQSARGRRYASVIDYNNRNGYVTGMAVQKTGNLLYVAHDYLNELHAVNKTTGLAVKNISLPAPRGLATDGDNNLWVIHKAPATQSNTSTGPYFGTAGYNNDGQYSFDKAFNGNVADFFAGTAGPNYIGIDEATPKVINQLRLYPRTGFKSRLEGKVLQGSNSSTTTGFQDLMTIPSNLIEGQYNTIDFANTTAYRYYRIFSTNVLDVSEVEFSVSVAPILPTLVKVEGTTFGTAGFNDEAQYSFVKAFDLNDATFFAGKAGITYLGIDAGAGRIITQLRLLPRPGFKDRLEGRVLQGSNTSATSGFTDLFTIPALVEGQYNTVNFPNTTPYRYYRIYSASLLDASEVSFYGDTTSVVVYNSGVVISGSPFGTAGYNDEAQYGFANAFNGNLNDFYAGQAGENFVGIDAGAGRIVNQLKLYPRAGFKNRLEGRVLQGSNVSSTSGFADIYTIPATLVEGQYNLLNFPNINSYRYYRLYSPILIDVTEAVFLGDANNTVTLDPAVISGTAYGTSSYNDQVEYAFGNAFNGNLSDFYAGKTGENYIGIDAGAGIRRILNQLKVYPRSGYKSRLEGSILQGSNTSATSGFVNLFTIPATLIEGQYNLLSVPNTNAFRYYRLYSPVIMDVTEVVFLGETGNAPVSAPTVITGNAFGTASYGDEPQYGFNNAFNGNLIDFFASKAGENYIGIDAGVGRIVNQVQLYPRAGFKDRLEGRLLQGSNISSTSGFVTIYRVPATLVEGQYNILSFTNTNAYRFYRLYSPSFLDVTELIFAGQTGTAGATNLLAVTGAPFGTPSYNNDPQYQFANAFNENLNDFYAGQGGISYLGMDAGVGRVVTRVKLYPRTGYKSRLEGRTIQGSNTSATSGFVDLYTIPSNLVEGQYNTFDFNNQTPYRYYRIYSNVWLDATEIVFYADATTTVTTSGAGSLGIPFGSAAYNDEGQYASGNAFNSNTNDFFAGTYGINYLGIDAGVPLVINKLRLFPRTGYKNRLESKVLQGSNVSQTAGWTDVFTLPADLTENQYNTCNFPNNLAYRYYRIYSADIMDATEVEFLQNAAAPAVSPVTKLQGNVFGSPGYLNMTEYQQAYAFNSNTNDFYAGNAGPNYVGIDGGSPQIVNQLRLYPRTGFKERLEGAILQGSNISTSTGFENIFTLPSTLTEGQYTTCTFGNGTAYRYYRIYSSSFLDATEIEFIKNSDIGLNQNPVGETSSESLVIADSVFVAEKFHVNSDGSITSLGIFITGLSDPLAISVSPDNSTVVVVDGGTSQQVKAYSNTTGAPSWTLGQAGGYANGANVTDDKFNFYSFDDEHVIQFSFIAFAPDGSFWMGDQGNARVQHYAADRTFLERVMYLKYSYSATADPNNPTRVFSDYLEFAIDYSKPLEPANGSWKLVKDWSYGITFDFDNNFNRLKCVTTLSNGRTYALAHHVSTNKWQIVELTPSGNLRFTGIETPGILYSLYADGSLWYKNQVIAGYQANWQRAPLLGFDSQNNPLYGGLQTLGSTETLKDTDPFSRSSQALYPQQVTSSDIIISFNETNQPGFHLGGVKKGTNKWLWKTSMSTDPIYAGEFPDDGSYDISNGVVYSGGFAQAIDRNIFWSYHGEFWKATQTNKYNHYYDDGLYVGQFGVTGADSDEEAAYGMAGNTFSGTFVKDNNGNIYLYHCDEGSHAGLHRWKITGLNSINEQSIPVVLLSLEHGLLAQYYDDIDLNNMSLKKTTLNLNVSVASLPSELTNTHNYSARWRGFVQPLFSGNHIFYIKSDDRYRLWVGDNLVIDHWTNDSNTELSSSPVFLNAGTRYPIKIEYSNSNGNGRIEMSWSNDILFKTPVTALNLYPARLEVAAGLNLMDGINWKSSLQNNLYGWQYSSGMSVIAGVQTTNRRSPDVQASLWSSTPATETLTRDLGTGNNFGQWTISGKIIYPYNDQDWGDGGAGYFEIVDGNGKIISRINRTMLTGNYSGLYANGQLIATVTQRSESQKFKKPQALTITASGGTLTIKFADYPAVNVTPVDASANWNNPKSMRLYYKLVGGFGQSHITSLTDMRFYSGDATDASVNDSSSGAATQNADSSITMAPADQPTVEHGVKAATIKVYPNPTAGHHFVVSLSNMEDGQYTISLITYTGQAVITRVIKYSSKSGNQAVPFDVNLSSGMYELQVRGVNTKLSTRVVVN